MCGLSGIVSIKNKNQIYEKIDITLINKIISDIENLETHSRVETHSRASLLACEDLKQTILSLKRDELFCEIFLNQDTFNEIIKIENRINLQIEKEEKAFVENMGYISSSQVDTISNRLETLKDISWCLSSEIKGNIDKIKSFSIPYSKILKQINSVLNSIDRLEVRGRDSCGISILFTLNKDEFENFKMKLSQTNLFDEFNKRINKDVLLNKGINLNESKNISISFTYKTAHEIGRLGDNVSFLRNEIKEDKILHLFFSIEHQYYTIVSHTRWASVGIITESNCHPMDNKLVSGSCGHIISVCLNGDIDNYLELKEEHEREGDVIHKDITTDTKIIPLRIEKYIKKGFDIKEAFRLALNDFKGSHAIFMQTDLAPGYLFLAQKGSGQAVFIGTSSDHYMPTSEVYGFVEETPDYIKLEGGRDRGQIFILNQESSGGLNGVSAIYYDGEPVNLTEKDIKHTAITSRDIDRQNYPHYFLKEISESPVSVEKTLLNRWKVKEGDKNTYLVTLDENVVPKKIITALKENRIKNIFFIGQGTAGIAAMVCSDILNYYMSDPKINIKALKASELSGFKLYEGDMSDCLIIAVTQSGTTADTNRAVDMVKEKGAHTISIVNRRDSDITFKVDGVMYTSSGRDIEMSVASTKAFYSQIIAGAVLGLYLSYLKGYRDDKFVTLELKQLLNIPHNMRKILDKKADIEKSAKRLATARTYWAVVGSGPNKASADEIRIKLSELCYKTISSDYVEDKKHIDLSSEPLLIVCAAGSRETVLGDIIKDTAIFKAHKAIPVVIADEGETRFKEYAEDVFYVPKVSEHLAPILNTLAGHIWGYYAALSINEASKFFYIFREDIQNTINSSNDIYELILERDFREKIAKFYSSFIEKKKQNLLPSIMGVNISSNLTLLLKYLSGRLPNSDFELDFGVKGTANNMLITLLKCLSDSIDCMARPIDAIKHQAKTVTVGTSRIVEKIEGIIFDKLYSYNFKFSQITPNNVIVLKNLQNVIADIRGTILYKISGLTFLGEITDQTAIEVINKDGILKNLYSRVEKDKQLKGTKRIIVRQGNVYIGKGRKDNQSILIIPVISTSPSTPNTIEYLLLYNIALMQEVPISLKIKALGGKYEHIKNIVQENSIIWNDEYIDWVNIEDLFGISAEKIGELIIKKAS
ncbi:MAG: SIS domain-containing protein [Desulfobacterales bacterium]|nr:SIS domain-containing protein [Desulfobacterales bacterium]